MTNSSSCFFQSLGARAVPRRSDSARPAGVSIYRTVGEERPDNALMQTSMLGILRRLVSPSRARQVDIIYCLNSSGRPVAHHGDSIG